MGKALREGSADDGRDEKSDSDHDGTGGRLREVEECAPRDEGNHRPQGDEDGSEQQQHRYPLTLQQAPTQCQIRPGERRDQCTAETREDEEQIEHDERSNDALEHDGHCVAKRFAWVRQQKQ